MSAFSFEALTDRIRSIAADSDDPVTAVEKLLTDTVADPGPILDATPDAGEDETLYFEDDNLSIWRCRFQPHVLMPPHEHKLKVLIAGYSGGEKSILYRRAKSGLEEIGSVTVGSGDVVMLGEDVIHAVTADGDVPSHAIHVYFGPLMTLKRDLFDWDSGEIVNFTMENFEAMKRTV